MAAHITRGWIHLYTPKQILRVQIAAGLLLRMDVASASDQDYIEGFICRLLYKEDILIPHHNTIHV